MSQSIFRFPYNAWSAEVLLAYYQGRTDVHYFPLRDAEQAAPEKIADILINRFTFNEESYILPAKFAWTENPSADKEWLILLHKFYFAAGLGLDICTLLFCHWQTPSRKVVESFPQPHMLASVLPEVPARPARPSQLSLRTPHPGA